MIFSKRFGIRLYIIFAICTLIIPIGLLSVLLPESAPELIMPLVLGLVLLMILSFILYRIVSYLYHFVMQINDKDSPFKQSAAIINLIKFMGVMPLYQQLEKLAHEYKLLHRKNQMLLNTKQADDLLRKKCPVAEDDAISLSNDYKLENFMHISAKTIRDLTKADSCSVMLYDEEIDALKIVASVGLSPYMARRFTLKPGEGIAGKAFQEHKSIMVEDVAKDSRFVISPKQQNAIQALYSVPIEASDRCIGVINIDTKAPLSEDKCKLTEDIAYQISIAIKNALLFKSMEELATKDSLTGLYNHRYLHQALAKEIERALRYSHPLSLVILDVDNFKQYNDNYGHMLGDYLLKEIGQVIRESLRTTDVLARYGGDELAVILPETGGESAYTLLERIRKRISEYQLITPEVLFNISNEFTNEDANLLIKSNTFWNSLFGWLKRANIYSQCSKQRPPAKVTLSAGICSLSKTVISKEDLIKKADIALIKAKRIGKNQICIYNSDLRDVSKATG